MLSVWLECWHGRGFYSQVKVRNNWVHFGSILPGFSDLFYRNTYCSIVLDTTFFPESWSWEVSTSWALFFTVAGWLDFARTLSMIIPEAFVLSFHIIGHCSGFQRGSCQGSLTSGSNLIRWRLTPVCHVCKPLNQKFGSLWVERRDMQMIIALHEEVFVSDLPCACDCCRVCSLSRDGGHGSL